MLQQGELVLNELLSNLGILPEHQIDALKKATGAWRELQPFIPSPGPQIDARNSEADILLFGGEGGGGKTGLGVGLALIDHRRSLLMRRKGNQLSALTELAVQFNGTAAGFNGSYPQKLRSTAGRLIDFGSCQYAGDELAWRGKAHDYLYIDEAGEFLEVQIRNLIGWVRSVHEGQRCRIVLGSNPPTTSDGDWMVKMFAPWLDPQHANPAAQGELRWFIMDDQEDIEVEGPGTYEYNGQKLKAMSRTFIRSRLSDNPFLRDTDYAARLDMLPEPLRSAVRDGNFMIARRDAKSQVIPTEWIMAAQARWTNQSPQGVPMCAMGVDIAQGGEDNTLLAMRYDGWYAPLVSVPGIKTPRGSDVAGLVVANRRDQATIILDMGGGYGGDTFQRLVDNGLEEHIVAYKGAASTPRRTEDGKLRFSNTRIAAYWKFREALNPDQPGGSPIALPPDNELVSDLTAVRSKQTPNGIAPAEDSTKEEVTKRLGRSPDKGDAVVMAWWGGKTIANVEGGWKATRQSKALKVNIGHGDKKPNRKL